MLVDGQGVSGPGGVGGRAQSSVRCPVSSSRLPVDGGSVDTGLQHIITGVRVGSGCGTSHRHPNAPGQPRVPRRSPPSRRPRWCTRKDGQRPGRPAPRSDRSTPTLPLLRRRADHRTSPVGGPRRQPRRRLVAPLRWVVPGPGSGSDRSRDEAPTTAAALAVIAALRLHRTANLLGINTSLVRAGPPSMHPHAIYARAITRPPGCPSTARGRRRRVGRGRWRRCRRRRCAQIHEV